MKPLSLQEFTELTAKAKVIHSKSGRDRIFEFPDSTILKLFYGKNNFSRAIKRAKRFARHCMALKKKGFISLEPIEVFSCIENNSVYVLYHKLPGTSLEQLLAEDKGLLEPAAEFIYSLHQKGIYFRDLHPGNILYSKGKFYLIDVQNINFHWFRVPARRRIKNLTTFLYNRSFKSLFNKENRHNLIESYALCAKLNSREKTLLLKKFNLFAQKRRQLLEW